MAEKAMHDRDYSAQLERSAYGHDQPKELSELNAGIEESMAVLRRKHLNDKVEAWEEFRRQDRISKGRDMAASPWTTTMNKKGNMARLGEANEANARRTDESCWARRDQWIFSVSQQAC